MNPLLRIPGVGEAAAEQLATHGFQTLQDVAATTVQQLVAVPGFGPTRAAKARSDAARLVGEAEAPSAATTERKPDKKKVTQGKPAKEEKSVGKKKDDKKADKKADKKKAGKKKAGKKKAGKKKAGKKKADKKKAGKKKK